MSALPSYDAVIVGGGHNGLVAGTYLAREGKRILIAERAPVAGGMARSDHVIPEAPDHMINMGAVELVHIRGTGLIDDLDLVRHGYRTVDTDPTYAYLDPSGESIALFRDPRRTAEDMARLSRVDGKAYLEFMELLDGLLDIAYPLMKSDPARMKPGLMLRTIGATIRNARLKRQLTELTSGTADQIVAERFEHPASLGLLLGIVAGAGPFDVDGNAIAWLLLAFLHRLGIGKPVGGMRMLADTLQSAYAEAGGELRLNAEVAEIVIEDGAAKGIRLVDGTLIAARAVVSTCDPKTAFGLVTPGAIERKLMVRMEHVPIHRANVGPLLLNVAMAKPVRLRRHQELRHDGADLNQAVGLIGTPDEIRASLASARRGDLPAPPVLSISPMTNWDPSQAPEGQSVAYLYLPVSPVRLRDGWDAARQQASDAIVARAAEFYEGFESEIGRVFETCPDRAKRLNVTDGCVTHVDFGSYRSGKRRPAEGLGGMESILPGFFLSGAGAAPGGGVSGLPGTFAAQRVTRYLKK
jgi:phytoene dehydrogenase-like protein